MDRDDILAEDTAREVEDDHLEAYYESVVATYEDYEPNPYDGTYSEC